MYMYIYMYLCVYVYIYVYVYVYVYVYCLLCVDISMSRGFPFVLLQLIVDPLGYFSFQPVLHDWGNKGCGMCYPV